MSDENFVPWAIFRIIFILIITSFLTSFVSFRFSTTDFETMRCFPTVIPFVSILNPEVSTVDNLHYCVKKIVTPMLRKNTSKALDEPVENITRTIDESNRQMNNLKEESNKFIDGYIQGQNTIRETFERSRFMGFYMTQKIQHFFTKIASSIIVFYYMFLTMINSVVIMFGGFLKIFNHLITTSIILITMGLTQLSIGQIPPGNPVMLALGMTNTFIGGITNKLGIALKISNEIEKNKSKCQA